MSLESGTYISDLVTTNPTGSDIRSQGDDHIRLVKSTIKSSFPDVNEASMTIHNGASAPSAKQTGTIWRDTGNSLWKFWNGTAWITLPFAFNTSNSVDVNAGTIDGVTIGGSSAPTVTNLGSVATCDINGGTIDGVTMGAASAPTVTNIDINGGTVDGTTMGASSAVVATNIDINGGNLSGVTVDGSLTWSAAQNLATGTTTIASADINGGSVDAVTLGTNSVCTDARIDNIRIDGNEVSVTDSGGDLTLTPNGSGDLILDGQKWPQADGANTNYLTTNGSGQIAWTTNTVVTSENNASASATASANSATASGNSATASASSATASQTARTGAETAQTAAETALDTFDDRMLGAKASAPSVDNDGNALIDGAMFFNTTSDYMMVYNLANTTWYQLTNTTSDQNNINTCAGSISNINTVGSNIGTVNDFSARYRVASSAPTTSLDAGDLYFDTTLNELKSYGTAWQSTAPSAANQTNINIVAGELVYEEDLGLITSALTSTSGNNITDVAGAIANINLLAPTAVREDMALLATTACVADMNLLGTSAVVEDLNLLGTSGNITAMGLLGVSGVITNMGHLGTSGNVTNMGTVAGSIADVNRYANEYTIASSAPGSPTEGDLWYDSTTNVLKYYTGSIFASISAGISDVVSDSSPQLGGALDCQNNHINNSGTISGANLQMDFGSIV